MGAKSRNIILASVVMGLIVVSSFWYESYSSYKREIRSAETQASNLSFILQEHIQASFQKIDLVLEDVQKNLQVNPGLLKNRRELNAYLLYHRVRISEAVTLKVHDQKGDLIGDDRNENPVLNISHRSFYQALKSSNNNELIISQPIYSQNLKKWIVIFNRPLLNKSGHFYGVIGAAIPIDYFQELFSKLNIGEQGSVALFGNDLTIYNRYPLRRAYLISKKLPATPALVSFISSNSDAAINIAKSYVDGYVKIYSQRKLRPYPLFLAVGVTLEEQLATWKLRTVTYSVLILLAFIIFLYFVNDFLKSQDELEEQRQLAMQSAKLTTLGEMASNIAHEINNPLTVISTLAMVTKLPDPQTENEKRLNANIDKIIHTVERIAKIVRSLRTFSRDSYNDPLLPTSVQAVLNSTFELCLQRLKNNNVEVIVEPFEDKLINCREYQIVQVLMNLLNNSLDAMDGIERKFIKIRVEDTGKKIKIWVQDSGPGISNEVIEKMMNPFFTTKEMGKGTGLGLSISKGIIENHKGEFYFDKTQQLTTFIIELPKVEG